MQLVHSWYAFTGKVLDMKYEIKSTTFPDQLIGIFRDLGEERNFADVTLVSDDQIQTPAHKVVLSACSPVLKALLVNNPHSHPLLYLRGIKQDNLQALLNFMYFGETQILEDKMNDFFNAAKDLKVKEINKPLDAGQCKETLSEKENLVIKTESNDVRRGNRIVAQYQCDYCDSTFTDQFNLRRHKKSKHEDKFLNKENSGTKVKEEEPLVKDIHLEIYQSEMKTTPVGVKRHHDLKNTGNQNGKYPCENCDFVFTDPSNLKRHKRSKHEGKSMQITAQNILLHPCTNPKKINNQASNKEEKYFYIV